MQSASQKFVIGIGSQRAGTTLLHTILSECTPVFMHPLKELHYFDTLFDTRDIQLLRGVSRFRHGRRTMGRRAKAAAASGSKGSSFTVTNSSCPCRAKPLAAPTSKDGTQTDRGRSQKPSRSGAIVSAVRA